MDKNILMISEGNTFMVNAIDKNLVEAGYTLTHIKPLMSEIGQHQRDADLILCYVKDMDDEEYTKALVYLKDICTEQDKQIILIGNDSDIKAVEGRNLPVPST